MIKTQGNVKVAPSVQRVFDRFKMVHKHVLGSMLDVLLAALQGDDEANGGKCETSQGPRSEADEEDDEYIADMDGFDGPESLEAAPGRGFETAKGSSNDIGNWTRVKE